VNRETSAAVTAVNTGLLIFCAVLLFAVVNHPGPGEARAGGGEPMAPWLIGLGAGELPDPVEPAVERGWGVYLRERCASCHSIGGQGSPRYPLDGVGSALTPELLRLWVVDPQRARPGVRKRPFDHLSEDEVAELVALLETLTAR
jgi:mono/diheme cytochrome c family protein